MGRQFQSGKDVFRLQADPWDVWTLAFPSVDLKIAVWRWNKEKAVSADQGTMVNLALSSARRPVHFFLVDSAKPFSVSCARMTRLRRWKIGGWSGKSFVAGSGSGIAGYGFGCS